MDRSALLKLIHKDLNELHLLLEGMEGYGEIPEPIIRLAKSKGEQLIESINELPGEVRIAIHERVEEETTIDDMPPEETKPEAHIEPVPEEVSEEPDTKHATLEKEKVADKPAADNEPDESVEQDSDNTVTAEETPGFSHEPDDKPSGSKKKVKMVLGETIEGGEKVIDKIKKDLSGSLGAKLEGSPIADLKKAININDRFMFQKELFGNNRDAFNASLEQLNNQSSFDEALEYMVKNYEWDFEDEITGRFVSLVNRRYK